MDGFWKAAAAILLTVILALAAGRQEKDLSVLMSMAVCCLAGVIAISYLEPVMDLMWELGELGEVSGGTLEILMKAVGIALVSEIAGMLCTDAGNGSLGKMLQMVGSAAILYLSIPLFRSLLTLIQEILGEL